jgi:hypothetical protein
MVHGYQTETGNAPAKQGPQSATQRSEENIHGQLLPERPEQAASAMLDP